MAGAAAGMGVKLKGFVGEEAFTHCESLSHTDMGEGAVVATPWVSIQLPPTPRISKLLHLTMTIL